jgi:hypothetical protein
MATPTLDLSLIQLFTPVFTFIFIFAVIYALMQFAKVLGDNKLLHSAIAFTIAIFGAVLSNTARDMIEYMVPWFTVFIIFTVLVIVMYKIFGATDDDVRTVIRKHSGVQWTIAIFAILIALGALSNSFGQKALAGTENPGEVTDPQNPDWRPGATTPGTTGTSDFSTNLNRTFYHPKVIGMLFLMLVATFAIAQLTRPITKGWP